LEFFYLFLFFFFWLEIWFDGVLDRGGMMTRYSFLASLYFGYIPPPFSFVVVHGKRMIWEFSLHFYLSAVFIRKAGTGHFEASLGLFCKIGGVDIDILT
jgi:hypothetical protein